MEKVEILTFSAILVAWGALACLFAIIVFKSRKYEDSFYKKTLKRALAFKILMTLLYFLYHYYIFKGGDTFEYYNAILEFKNAFRKYPIDALQSIFQQPESFSNKIQNILQHEFYSTPEESLTVKCGALFGVLLLGNYLAIAFVYSFFALAGIWRLYKTCCYLFPNYKKLLAFFILFFPTTVFWSSSISKDALVMGAVGFLLHSFYKFFIAKKALFINGLILIGSYLLILEIKGYVLVAMIPGLIIWLLLHYKNSIANKWVRRLSTPFFIGLLLLIFIVGLNLMNNSNSLKNFTIDEISSSVISYNNYLSNPSLAGSAYNIGVLEPNLNSIIKIFPAAINVTLFRPYLWETNNAASFLTAVESLFTLIFTLFVLLKTGIYTFTRNIFKSPFLLYCLIFTLIFAGAVGMTSGNFGTLARYKIICLPFYFTMLIVLWQDSVAKKREKKREVFIEGERSLGS